MINRSVIVASCLVLCPACATTVKLVPCDADVVLSRQLLDAPNPARPGDFSVQRLFYGSGDDRRRPEFRDSVSLITESVDASKLVSLGNSADERNSYWAKSDNSFKGIV